MKMVNVYFIFLFLTQFAVIGTANPPQLYQLKPGNDEAIRLKGQVAYKNLLPEPGRNTVKGDTLLPAKKKAQIQLVDEPGFPAYFNTGNQQKDDSVYSAAKNKWIQEHPERYREMCAEKK
jgi:hypothetical protein